MLLLMGRHLKDSRLFMFLMGGFLIQLVLSLPRPEFNPNQHTFPLHDLHSNVHVYQPPAWMHEEEFIEEGAELDDDGDNVIDLDDLYDIEDDEVVQDAVDFWLTQEDADTTGNGNGIGLGLHTESTLGDENDHGHDHLPMEYSSSSEDEEEGGRENGTHSEDGTDVVHARNRNQFRHHSAAVRHALRLVNSGSPSDSPTPLHPRNRQLNRLDGDDGLDDDIITDSPPSSSTTASNRLHHVLFPTHHDYSHSSPSTPVRPPRHTDSSPVPPNAPRIARHRNVFITLRNDPLQDHNSRLADWNDARRSHRRLFSKL